MPPHHFFAQSWPLRRAKILGFLFLSLSVACQVEPLPPPATLTMSPPDVLRIGLSDSAAPIAGLVNEEYAQIDQVALQFITANDATLVMDLAAGQLDAILIHHIPESNTNWFNPVALDGLAIVVHPDNPVNNLDRAEVQAIFNGRIGNWAAVGGPDLPITLIGREPGAGARVIFAQRVMAEQRISINALIESSNQALLETVAADPAAIGYAMMGSTVGLKLLTIDAIAPVPRETAVQRYPLTVPLYFVAAGADEPAGELRALLAWLQSEAGQTVLGDKYGRVR